MLNSNVHSLIWRSVLFEALLIIFLIVMLITFHSTILVQEIFSFLVHVLQLLYVLIILSKVLQRRPLRLQPRNHERRRTSTFSSNYMKMRTFLKCNLLLLRIEKGTLELMLSLYNSSVVCNLIFLLGWLCLLYHSLH